MIVTYEHRKIALKQLTIAALAVALQAAMLGGQTTPPQGGAAPGRGGRGAPAPALRSPEVNADRTVTFRVRAPQANGVDFPDPANISVMPRAAGTAVSSFVEVPGDGAAFYDSRPVPHGEVRMVLYESKAMGVNRYMWVYTPPNYEKSTVKYPVY